MVTPSEAQFVSFLSHQAVLSLTDALKNRYAIYDWLSWLKNQCRFQCKTWMIDCSDTESAAISKAIADATILACLWHVLEAVAKQSKEKLVSTLFFSTYHIIS